MNLELQIWPVPKSMEIKDTFSVPLSVNFAGEFKSQWAEDFNQLTTIPWGDDYQINFHIDNSLAQEEYHLTIHKTQSSIVGGEKGLFYGFQTFLQIILLGYGAWHEAIVNDIPAYSKRCFMADMGRSVWTLPLLKNLVKVLARLKMNQLHLHLYDDELCGIKFKNHPFGSCNPYALTLEDLDELIKFAYDYQIEIVPELEAWAHVASIVYYRPELRGGSGVYNGASFLFTEATFDLMEDLVGQVCDILPDNSTIHLGLDEANWFVADDMPKDFSPSDMVQRYYDMLQKLGKERNKNFTMRIWADHSGRPLPEDISDKIIVEPWNYWQQNYEKAIKDTKNFSNGNTPWMAGAGQSLAHYRAVYHASRFWCREGFNAKNLLGINLTFWGRNTIDENLMMLYAGAGYIWNPFPKRNFDKIEDNEASDRILYPMMYNFQAIFPEANREYIAKLREVSVYCGFYWFNKNHGQGVSPTVIAAKTATHHDFLNEHM